ncbi:hypothetical protein IQ265_28140 [Nodosilinea sp. LEGE 06152]|uniref:hypothetical protein n=1 Tax=Nodosilinea sp. LEGE 06152 TaxID=2777966 RepID=UPI00187F307A|nr:hypothetical protein [Nodosilinea sp. LEGE 06152]MBE9160663.1 hypothetical protein [Nodosilinea sp. LEGE 06152]
MPFEPITFSSLAPRSVFSYLTKKKRESRLRKKIADFFSSSDELHAKNSERPDYKGSYSSSIKIKNIKDTDIGDVYSNHDLGNYSSKEEKTIIIRNYLNEYANSLNGESVEIVDSGTDTEEKLDSVTEASVKFLLESLSSISTGISNKITDSLDSPDCPEEESPRIHLTIADEYYKEELRYSIVYSIALTSAFLIQSFFISHHFYGIHLLLVVLALVIISRACLIKYRISQDFFGSSPHEAQMLIQYILDNCEKIEPPDDGSMSVFPAHTDNEESVPQEDLGLGGELA